MDVRRGDGDIRPLARLGMVKGPDTGSDLAITSPEATVGKSARNEVVIDDDSVSTRHARLTFEAGGWTITDLGSANGTFVDGVRLNADVPSPLAPGATIRFGAVQGVFQPSPDADPARAAYAPPPSRTRVADRRSGFRFPLWLLLVLVILVAAIWFGLVWQPEPEPAPEPLPTTEQPAIGVTSTTPPPAPPA